MEGKPPEAQRHARPREAAIWEDVERRRARNLLVPKRNAVPCLRPGYAGAVA